MLLPKEDRETNRLMYVCRTCAHTEPAQTPCVYRNQLHNTVGETAGVTQDVGADPTVGSGTATSLVDASCTFCALTCTHCGEEIHCNVCGIAAADERDEVARYSDDMLDENDLAAIEMEIDSGSEGAAESVEGESP